MIRAALAIVAAILLTFGKSAHAAPSPEFVILDRAGQFDFQPKRAEFVVAFDTLGGSKVPALVVPPKGNQQGDPSLAAWQFAARIRVPLGAQMLRSFLIVHGDGNEIQFLPVEEAKLTAESFFNGSPDSLRNYLLERKKDLSAAHEANRALEVKTAQVRKDAEVIGNFGRILDAREEIEKTNAEIKDLEKDNTKLTQFIAQASSYPSPTNLFGREQQLTRQIAELAEIAKDAERDELARRYRGESEVARRMAILESTRGEDPEVLEEQLKQLRGEGSAE